MRKYRPNLSQSVSRIVTRIIVLVLGGFIFTPTYAQNAQSPALIVARGVCEKSIDPNLISLNVEVWSRAQYAKTAQSLLAQEMKRVKNVFDNFRIKKEDQQSIQYSLDPEYVYDTKTQQNRMQGYRAVQVTRAILRKTEEAGTFLDQLSGEGKSSNSGVNLNSIVWDSDKKDSAQTSCLSEAVKDSRTKAEEIAKAAGVKIKSLYKIVYNGPVQIDAGGIRLGMARVASFKESAANELSSGQIKVSGEVQAEFEIQQ